MAVTTQRLKETKDAVKLAVTSAAESVYQQLEDRFPPTSVGEALSIIDPRFWLTSPAMEVVLAAIKAIKKVYGEPKRVGAPSRLVPARINSALLEEQARFMFGIAPQLSKQVLSEYKVEEEAKGGRPEAAMPGFTTMFWRRLMNTQAGIDHLSEWAVLAELALVMVPGSVEAERMFSTMSFLKDKVRNRLTTHLGPCARIYSQSTYSLANFPYEEALKHWHAAAEIRGRYGLSSNTY